MTGNVILAVINPPSSGQTHTFRFSAQQAASGGPFTLTFFPNITWVGLSTAPPMVTTASGIMEAVFTTNSAGASFGRFVGYSNTDPAGAGIGTGTTNQLGYYAAPGTTLSPLNLGTGLSIASGALNAAGSTITEVSQTASFTAAAGGFYAISGSSAVTATLAIGGRASRGRRCGSAVCLAIRGFARSHLRVDRRSAARVPGSSMRANRRYSSRMARTGCARAELSFHATVS